MNQPLTHEWKKVKLEDVASVIDCPHSTPKWEKEGVLAIRNFNLSNGYIVKDKVSYVSEDAFIERTKRAIPKQGDCILSREAPIGSVGYISTEEKMCLGQRVVLIQPKDNIDSRFLLYQLLSRDVQKQFQLSEGTGATVSNLRIPAIKHTVISYVDIEHQKIISSQLAHYDDLIINTNRRIKILEAIAEKVYREWFGSDKDTVSANWSKVKLSECLSVLRGKSYTGKDLEKSENSIPLVNLKCIKRNGGFRKDGLKTFSGKYKESHIVHKGDIVMAVTDMTQERLIVARSARVPSLGVDFGVISMDLVKIEPKENCDRDFLYAYLRWSDFADNVKNYANGANVLHLLPDRIAEYEIFLPPLELQRKFSSVVKDMFEQIDILELACDNLKKTRDLLIPQLVTGKLAIKS